MGSLASFWQFEKWKAFEYDCSAMPEEKGDKADKKGPIIRAMMKAWDAKNWKPYFEMLGLKDEETAERLVRLLVIHLLLDRFVTELLTAKLLDPNSEPGTFGKIQLITAPLEMEARIELAQAANLISPSCASNMKILNTVRNKLAHYHPKQGWGVGHIQELSSVKAYEQCIEKGLRSLDELLPALSKKLKELAPG